MALDEALNLVNAAGELDNRNASVFGVKAMILYKRDDTKEAVRAAQAALEIEPTNAEATAVLAAERFARGDTDGALLILDRESAAHEKSLGIQLFKIKIFEQTKNFEQLEFCSASLSRTTRKNQGSERHLSNSCFTKSAPMMRKRSFAPWSLQIRLMLDWKWR